MYVQIHAVLVKQISMSIGHRAFIQLFWVVASLEVYEAIGKVNRA